VVHRHLVLNSLAVFIYKDDVAFQTFPEKPLIVLPLLEIKRVQKGKIEKKKIAKTKLLVSSRGDKSSYVNTMQIVLKRRYNSLQSKLLNFLCKVQNGDSSLSISSHESQLRTPKFGSPV